MDSFFIYRMPGSHLFTGNTGSIFAGLSSGFVIAPFEWDDKRIFTIKAEHTIGLQDLDRISIPEDSGQDLFPFPLSSTTKEKHIGNVGKFISRLKIDEKAVCARIIRGEGEIDIRHSLQSLSDAFPDALIYCFSSPRTGTWLGATPENLLNVSSGTISTMALAGTRLAGKVEEWDEKNIKEQRIVADFIYDTLLANNLKCPLFPKAYTKNAGLIEHLCSDFSLPLPSGFGSEQCKRLLRALSPTPALCGFPRDKALTIIKETESFPRGYYGGFLGPVDFNAMKMSLFVLLRSVKISDGGWCMFAGGGITADSDPESEWTETENKAKSILGKLIFAK